MKNDKLYKSLRMLCNKVMKMINEHRGELVKTPQQRIPVAKYDYFAGYYDFDWNAIEYFDLYSWEVEDLDRFKKSIFALKEFNESVQILSDRLNIDEKPIRQLGLPALINLLITHIPNNNINGRNINQYIKLFVNEYENVSNPKFLLTWKVDLWLNDITLESDSIKIARGVLLKKPTKDQLAIVEKRNDTISAQRRMFGKSLPSSAILSLKLKVPRKTPQLGFYSDKIVQEIETWLNILRLFRPASISVIYQSVTPVSIFEHSISENKQKPYDKFWEGKVEQRDTSTSEYNILIKKDEEKLLKSFVKKLYPILNSMSPKTYLSGNSYDLALHRYNDALLKSEVKAYKILSAMSSIEALLSNESTEITYKMRIRVAKLLSFFGFEGIETYNKIQDAYSLRSKIVHGLEPKEKKKNLLDFAREHTHEIVNYNRICLLILLQLKDIINKDDLIKKINHSLIDKKTNVELGKKIKNKVRIPITHPFISNP